MNCLDECAASENTSSWSAPVIPPAWSGYPVLVSVEVDDVAIGSMLAEGVLRENSRSGPWPAGCVSWVLLTAS